MGLPQGAWVKKTANIEERKNVKVQLFVKKVRLTEFWVMKGPITIDVIEK